MNENEVQTNDFPSPFLSSPTPELEYLYTEETPLIDSEKFASRKQKLLDNHEISQEHEEESRKAGIPSSVFNLTNTIIGGGVLALPYAFSVSGILLGWILIFGVAALCYYSAYLLDISGVMSGKDRPSYNDLAARSLGTIGPKIVDIAMVLFLMGACIGYLVIIGDILAPFCKYIDDGCPVDWVKRAIMAFIAITILLPLMCLRRINSLSFTSFVAIICIAYIVCVVTIKGVISLAQHGIDSGEIRYFRFHQTVLTVIPVMAFAFTFHISLFPIQNEMVKPTQMKWVTLGSIGICLTTYMCIGSFGYLTFYQEVNDNILVAYSTSDIEVEIGKVALAIIICFSYPVLGFPARTIFDALVFPKSQPSPFWRILLEAVTWIFGTLLFAMIVPNISVVFGIFGATVGNLVVYILPAWFYLYFITENDKIRGTYSWQGWERSYKWFTLRKIGPFCLLIFGILMSIICTLAIIIDLFDGDTPLDPDPNLDPAEPEFMINF